MRWCTVGPTDRAVRGLRDLQGHDGGEPHDQVAIAGRRQGLRLSHAYLFFGVAVWIAGGHGADHGAGAGPRSSATCEVSRGRRPSRVPANMISQARSHDGAAPDTSRRRCTSRPGPPGDHGGGLRTRLFPAVVRRRSPRGSEHRGRRRLDALTPQASRAAISARRSPVRGWRSDGATSELGIAACRLAERSG